MAQKIKRKLQKPGKGGSYSIYLPKEWVEKWLVFDENAEVVLIELGDHMVLSSPKKVKKKEISIKTENDKEVKNIILSTYVKGYEEIRLIKDNFNVGQQTIASTFLRQLPDVIPIIEEKEISYKSRVGYDMSEKRFEENLSLLFRKNSEIIEHTTKLLTYHANPQMVTHEIRMVYSIEEEDIDPLTFQMIRAFSNFAIPCENICDIQYYAMVGYILERIGDTLYGIAELVCDIYSIQKDEMNYPQKILIDKVTKALRDQKNSIPTTLVKFYIDTLKKSNMHLQSLEEIVYNKDGRKALSMGEEIKEFREEMEKKFLKEIENLQHNSEGYNTPPQVFIVGYRIRELLTYIESLCGRTNQFYFSK